MNINQRIAASNTSLEKIYGKYRSILGVEMHSELINDLQNVYVETIRKEEALPKKSGILDANSYEIRAMSKERDLEVILIKQTYGI